MKVAGSKTAGDISFTRSNHIVQGRRNPPLPFLLVSRNINFTTHNAPNPSKIDSGKCLAQTSSDYEKSAYDT
jgi:hypothetical protein